MEKITKSNRKDEIDLWELWAIVRSGRRFIVIVTALFTLAGIAYAFLAQEWFEAEVVLAPVSQQSNVSEALGGLGGLARIAGVNLSGIGGDKQPVAVLKSKEFARQFIEDWKLVSVLREGRSDDSKAPDIRDAVYMFDKKVRKVTEDARTRLVKLTIQWKDPETAALWANALAKRLNDRLREQAAADAERNIAYLQKEMGGISVVSLRMSLGSVLESEMQKLMLARGNEEFAFNVIDKATPPKYRAAPLRWLVILASVLTGAFLSVLFLVVRWVAAARRETHS